jgi:hypothetical protein
MEILLSYSIQELGWAEVKDLLPFKYRIFSLTGSFVSPLCGAAKEYWEKAGDQEGCGERMKDNCRC